MRDKRIRPLVWTVSEDARARLSHPLKAYGSIRHELVGLEADSGKTVKEVEIDAALTGPGFDIMVRLEGRRLRKKLVFPASSWKDAVQILRALRYATAVTTCDAIRV